MPKMPDEIRGERTTEPRDATLRGAYLLQPGDVALELHRDRFTGFVDVLNVSARRVAYDGGGATHRVDAIQPERGEVVALAHVAARRVVPEKLQVGTELVEGRPVLENHRLAGKQRPHDADGKV